VDDGPKTVSLAIAVQRPSLDGPVRPRTLRYREASGHRHLCPCLGTSPRRRDHDAVAVTFRSGAPLCACHESSGGARKQRRRRLGPVMAHGAKQPVLPASVLLLRCLNSMAGMKAASRRSCWWTPAGPVGKYLTWPPREGQRAEFARPSVDCCK
jgi:hypothetical protein